MTDDRNAILIASQSCDTALDALPEGASLEDRLTAAMRSVRGHWLCTNEESQFIAALGAVAQRASPEEVERITAEVEDMRRASAMLEAMQAGVSVDLEQMLADKTARDEERGFTLIGLRGLWEASA